MSALPPGRWPRLIATVVLTFALLLFAGLLLPLVVGMARSGGAAGTQSLQLLGLDVVTVVTNGSGGFESTFGSGVVLLPLMASAVVGLAGVVGIVRDR